MIELLVQREDEVSKSRMVQYLWKSVTESIHKTKSSASRRIDLILFDLIETMQEVWDKGSPLEKAKKLVSAAVETREASKKEEFDRSRQKIRGVATIEEGETTCWVHKEFCHTANNVETLREAFEASRGKEECQVRVTGIERECWMGTEIDRLGS